MLFCHKILLWYAKNKRTLPWRRTRDPYKIWLSEIILQQTRVAQGLPYYLKFIHQYPKVADLAQASEEDVLKLWQGLGYYSRARNLHATAKMVVDQYQGQFPNTYNGLLALKGVGDYTASAIASICYFEPQPVVDGNVYRVLARYFGVEIPINSAKGIKYFRKLAGEVMDMDNIRDYNQGIMEFGALQCTPQSPDCTVCPLQDGCSALQKKRISELPIKLVKSKIRKRFFNYLVPVSVNKDRERQTLLRQRLEKGIWQHLWEFPLLESDNDIGLETIKENMHDTLKLTGKPRIYKFNEAPIVHKLSHQHLYTWFWIVETEGELKEGINLTELPKYPVPVLIAEFIETFKNSYF